MAMATLAAARRVAALGRVSSPTASVQASTLVPRRGLFGAADHNGASKVNCSSQPTNSSQWKEEHFVIASLTFWGLLIYGSCKFFTKGKKAEDFTRAFNVKGGSRSRARRYRTSPVVPGNKMDPVDRH